MQTSHFNTRNSHRGWSLRYAQVRRGGKLLLMTLCQAALLLVIVETSTETFESSSEWNESIELVEALPGTNCTKRGLLAGIHAVRLTGESGRAGRGRIDRGAPPARKGHCLSNGLTAPFRC